MVKVSVGEALLRFSHVVKLQLFDVRRLMKPFDVFSSLHFGVDLGRIGGHFSFGLLSTLSCLLFTGFLLFFLLQSQLALELLSFRRKLCTPVLHEVVAGADHSGGVF